MLLECASHIIVHISDDKIAQISIFIVRLSPQRKRIIRTIVFSILHLVGTLCASVAADALKFIFSHLLRLRAIINIRFNVCSRSKSEQKRHRYFRQIFFYDYYCAAFHFPVFSVDGDEKYYSFSVLVIFVASRGYIVAYVRRIPPVTRTVCNLNSRFEPRSREIP